MQTASSRNWTLFSMFISYDDNHCTTKRVGNGHYQKIRDVVYTKCGIQKMALGLFERSQISLKTSKNYQIFDKIVLLMQEPFINTIKKMI